MPRQEVGLVTASLGAKPLQRARGRDHGQWYAARLNENAWLAFDQTDGLEAVTFTWAFGLMGVGTTPKTYLCTGVSTVRLSVTFAARWEGYPVYVDGIETCRVGEWRFCEFEVPLGKHVLEIRYPDGIYTQDLAFGDDADGNPHVHVP